MDNVSVLTWNNVSQDLLDGFSPYVDIGKGEWPSSKAAGSFASDPLFTPRDTGSAHILGESIKPVSFNPLNLDCRQSVRLGVDDFRPLHHVRAQHGLPALSGQR